MQEKAELWELLPPLDYTIQAVDERLSNTVLYYEQE
jgi:hypothetical protein